MKNKSERIIGLFYNYPAKQWHFNDIIKESKVTRSKVDKWLKYYVKHNFIKRIKERNRMPYYISNYECINYQIKKKQFAQNKLLESGLLDHLNSLKDIKCIILFGSFSRWDWTKNSDVDLFIYGNVDDLRLFEYELKLHKEIQLFVCNTKKDLNKYDPGLLRNIIEGDLIKGDIGFLEVNASA